MENQIEIYKKNNQPPDWAMKQIEAGRLKGKTDINPQWRILALTETYGLCGFGWKYTIEKQWIETSGSESSAFVNISLYIKLDGNWSEPIYGTGGSSFVAKEKNGPYQSDECFKMALTDAISVACKMIGIGANIYSGSKYIQCLEEEDKKKKEDNLKNKSKTQALSEMQNCKDLDEVKNCWTKWKSFQTDAEFSQLKEEMKISLTAIPS